MTLIESFIGRFVSGVNGHEPAGRQNTLADVLPEGKIIRYSDPTHEWISDIVALYPFHLYPTANGKKAGVRIPKGTDRIAAAEYDLPNNLHLSISQMQSENSHPNQPFHVTLTQVTDRGKLFSHVKIESILILKDRAQIFFISNNAVQLTISTDGHYELGGVSTALSSSSR